MFDSAKFIQEVEKRPSLWDKTNADFDCRETKSKNWNDIADHMYPDWKMLGHEEKKLKGKELLLKWRNIKDTFRKIIKYDISGTADQKKKYNKKYLYWNYLQFLRPGFEIDFTSAPKHKKALSPEAKKRKTHSTNDDARNDRPQKISKNNADRHDRRDDDEMFFLSLVPTIRHMTLLSKIKVKIEIMKVIQKNLHEGNILIPNVSNNQTVDSDRMESTTNVETVNNPWAIDIEDVIIPKLESSHVENSNLDKVDDDME